MKEAGVEPALYGLPRCHSDDSRIAPSFFVETKIKKIKNLNVELCCWCSSDYSTRSSIKHISETALPTY